MLTYFSNNLSFIMISLLLLFLTHTAPCYITHMYVAGVDVIRRVGFSLQNNSGVIVCDKWKNEQNCNGILYLKKQKKPKILLLCQICLYSKVYAKILIAGISVVNILTRKRCPESVFRKIFLPLSDITWMFFACRQHLWIYKLCI